ncbi:SH3 domain-containing protein [Actinosynnema sp. NPDC047251]|uniref:Uncharacterized protein n=1 Tax=Saccharothrix espanaensis (strain ATCC 51144 / DSM 44229 / JCM 9112 / NBRC 15066 / NRRL 15764) TaxID=1179773 RepID=K0K064_SACES|nr:SH3 domain-containing protein [Saccharothrix espanaensis]CCH31711.1 hypothetical protein BN6_44300 [Saccharothrix espanaensis DSM 44229]
MNKTLSAITLATTLFGCATLGGVAGADPAPAAGLQSPADRTSIAAARCAGYGWVISNTDGLHVRSGPGTNYDILVTVNRGHRLSCFPVVAGGRYTACGTTDANGWIPVDRDGNARIDGYVASTCVRDA